MKRIPLFKNTIITIPAGPNKGYKFSVNTDSYYASGQYETESIIKMLGDLDNKSVVYDIGANMGYYSLAFSKVVSQVYSFEPLPKNYDLAKKHLELNNISNVNLNPYAITDKKQKLQFTNSLAHSSNTYMTDSTSFADKNSTIEVQGYSLDNLIYDLELPKPHFLKVDVEGAELDFLKGAERVLKEVKPTFVLATHDKLIPGISKKCLAFLDSIGYSYRETEEIKDSDGLIDYFVSPN